MAMHEFECESCICGKNINYKRTYKDLPFVNILYVKENIEFN